MGCGPSVVASNHLEKTDDGLGIAPKSRRNDSDAKISSIMSNDDILSFGEDEETREKKFVVPVRVKSKENELTEVNLKRHDSDLCNSDLSEFKREVQGDTLINNTEDEEEQEDAPIRLQVGDRVAFISESGQSLNSASVIRVGRHRKVLVKIENSSKDGSEWKAVDGLAKYCAHCEQPVSYSLLDAAGKHPNCFYSTLNGQFLKASMKGNRVEMDRLLSQGVSIDAKDSLGNTSLHLAASRGKIDIAKFLISKGASINEVNNLKATPLLSSVMDEDVIQFFIENGSDLRSTDEQGDNILHIAARRSANESVLLLLLDRGVPINSVNLSGKTPLHRGAITGSEEVCELLINKGASLYIEDKEGKKPFDYTLTQPELNTIFCKAMHIDVTVVL